MNSLIDKYFLEPGKNICRAGRVQKLADRAVSFAKIWNKELSEGAVTLTSSPSYPLKKGGKLSMKTIKILAIVAIAASALSLGACASKKETMMTTTPASTGMSK